MAMLQTTTQRISPESSCGQKAGFEKYVHEIGNLIPSKSALGWDDRIIDNYEKLLDYQYRRLLVFLQYHKPEEQVFITGKRSVLTVLCP